jgi:hypothetical protein
LKRPQESATDYSPLAELITSIVLAILFVLVVMAYTYYWDMGISYFAILGYTGCYMPLMIGIFVIVSLLLYKVLHDVVHLGGRRYYSAYLLAMTAVLFLSLALYVYRYPPEKYDRIRLTKMGDVNIVQRISSL